MPRELGCAPRVEVRPVAYGMIETFVTSKLFWIERLCFIRFVLENRFLHNLAVLVDAVGPQVGAVLLHERADEAEGIRIPAGGPIRHVSWRGVGPGVGV